MSPSENVLKDAMFVHLFIHSSTYNVYNYDKIWYAAI